jgi:Na+/proline symporter
MYEMVQNAYKVTLVGAFVPLAAGIYWKRANVAGAIMSIVLGLASWGAMELWGAESMWPAQLVGLGFAIAGMIVGSLVTRVPGHSESALAPHPPHAGGHR